MPEPTQDLRVAEGLLRQQPEALVVNGFAFFPRPERGDRIYTGPRQERISFLSLTFEASRRPSSIPREITVSGRRFTRRCENYFLPIDANAEDIERLFDHIAPCYEAVTDTALNRVVTRNLLEMAVQGRENRKSPIRIADFGCGSGATWRELESLARSRTELQDVELYGCDLSQEMVNLCRRRGYTRASRCGYARTAFSSNMFDAVIATFVMHYFVDGAPVEEIRRILKPGGVFIASLPSPERAEMDRFQMMLEADPLLGGVSASDLSTHAGKPRSIPILRCEKSGPSAPAIRNDEMLLPDEFLPA